ncbi:MAG: hypothetical protein FJY92_12260, partial [Candidatus Hydrogenedentes bacterium]|nr:hypothetical protein [Candidatus Hydrogenedentota bacterium]
MSEGRGTSLRWRECVMWAGVLLLIQVISFSGFFFRNEVLVPYDLLYEVEPWRDYQPPGYSGIANVLMYDPIMAFRPDFQRFQEVLRSGRWPLWNDREMAGLPLLANCQSRVFYPPHLAVAFTDVDAAMSLFVVFKLWLAPFLAYVCARALGFGVWPSRWYSIAWGVGCFVRIWAYWPIGDVLAWAPVVFVGTEWLVERRLRKGFFALALGGTMLLFAGHPETAFAINAYIALYFAVRLALAWRNGHAPWRAVALYAGAWALAIAVYAVQLLPFIEYLRNAASVEERIDMPLTFNALATFWVPRLFGTIGEKTFWDKNLHNSNLTIEHYAGMAAWLGIAFAMVYALRRSSLIPAPGRARVASLAAVSLISVMTATGAFFIDWVQAVPGFSHTRTIYHVYFALFALPLLGLIGLDAWLGQPRRLRDLAPVLAVVLPACALVAFIWWYNGGMIRLARLDGYVTRELLTACAALA